MHSAVHNEFISESNKKLRRDRIEFLKILMIIILTLFKRLNLLFPYAEQLSKWRVDVSTLDPKFQKIF